MLWMVLVPRAASAAMSIANDQKNQAVDRFRSLPLAKGAVIGGYAVANILKTVLPIVIMSLTGLVIGWRIRGSFLDTLAARDRNDLALSARRKSRATTDEGTPAPAETPPDGVPPLLVWEV